MITDSYSASCYVKNENGKYQMACDMTSNNKQFSSSYDGEDFIDGLNKIMEDLNEQMLAESTKSDQEPEQETLEDKVARLEGLVEQLQKENARLTDYIDEQYNKNNYKIDDAIKSFEDIMQNYFDENDLKNMSTSAMLHWPFKTKHMH